METKEQVEREIASYARILAEKKRRLNGFLPIARLPVEVLAEIFLFYTYPDKHARISCPPVPKDAIFVLIQVCHHWREVALTSPHLWSKLHINFISRAHLEGIFQRSRHLPLDISLECDWEPWLDILETILLQMHRIHTLELWGCGEQELQEFLPRPAPLLKRLVVVYYGSCDLSGLESCDMPSLETLHVQSSSVSWTSSFLRPTLTRLCLRDINFMQEQSYLDVLNALGSLSLLRNLDLSNSLPVPHSEPLLDRTVNLPYLREIRIEDRPSSIAWLFYSLVFPRSTLIKLHCEEAPDQESMEGLQSLLAAVGAKWTAVGSTGHAFLPSAALFYAPEPSKLHPIVTFYCDCTAVEDGGSWRKRNLSKSIFQLTFMHNPDPLFNIPTAILRELPLSNLTTLHLPAFPAMISVEDWASCCTSMTQLRRLHLSSWGQDDFPKALALHLPIPPSPDLQAVPAPLFPRLEQLYLTHVNICGVDYSILELAIRGTRKTSVDEHIEALRARIASGIPLRRLVLRRCYRIKQVDVDKLSQYVTVKWDGITRIAKSRLYSYSDDEAGDEDEDEDDTELEEDG